MPFVPKTIESIADYEALSPGTALKEMGIGIESVDDDHMAITMPIESRFLQPAGVLHGGMTMFLIESAASMHACWRVNLAERVPVGIEINGSHVRSASGGTARAVARVVRRSHTMIVHTIEVFHAESGRLISTGRMTNYYVHIGKPNGG